MDFRGRSTQIQHERLHPLERDWFHQAEIANMWTHCAAFLLGVFAFNNLLQKSLSTNNPRIVGASLVYGICVLLTFLTSTLYHAINNKPRLRALFHTLDHLLIYLMIAGTYTPFTLVTLRDSWGPTLFLTIWILALCGILFTLFGIKNSRILSTVLYVILGWVGAVAIVPIAQVLPFPALLWLVGGGIIYTIGVLFYILDGIPFSHTIWHFFVILGALFQFICIYQYVV